MKKFLFTLAALLMAGSAFAAENYLYINDFEITEDSYVEGLVDLETGDEFTGILVTVGAHFDQMASAWQLALDIPEGLTVKNYYAGENATVPYKNNLGQNKTVDASITSNDLQNYFGITTAATVGYWKPENKWESYGVVKWEIGDYPEMFVMMVAVDPSFNGGTIKLSGSLSCGADTRPIETVGSNYPFETTCNVTVKQDTPPAQPAPVPTFDWSAESFTMEAVCEGHNVVLMKGDETVSNPFTVTQTYEEQQITFKAYTVAKENESGNSAVIDTTVVVPAKQKTASNKPSIVVTPGDDNYTIEATGTGTVELYINGEKVEGTTYTVARPAYGEDPITVEVMATNLDSDPDGEIQYAVAEDSKTVTVLAKDPKYYQTKTPTVTVTEGADAYTLTASCEDEGQVVLVVQYIDDETATFVTERYTNGTVTINRTDKDQYINYWAEATANTPDGYDGVLSASSAAVNYFKIPAKEVVVVPELEGEIVFSAVNQEDGSFTVSYNGPEEGVTVTVTSMEPKRDGSYNLPGYGTYDVTAVAKKEGYKDLEKTEPLTWTKPEVTPPTAPVITIDTGDEEVTLGATEVPGATVVLYQCDNAEGDNPVAIDNPTSFMMKDEAYDVYVYAVATNDAGETSSVITKVTIPAKTATSVDELVNGKTVAGVRYFNMAGQEMQEANGITIVVTTYTDGTTSAVKVIK